MLQHLLTTCLMITTEATIAIALPPVRRRFRCGLPFLLLPVFSCMHLSLSLIYNLFDLALMFLLLKFSIAILYDLARLFIEQTIEPGPERSFDSRSYSRADGFLAQLLQVSHRAVEAIDIAMT